MKLAIDSFQLLLRKNITDLVDKERALQPYPHDICSDECRKRG